MYSRLYSQGSTNLAFHLLRCSPPLQPARIARTKIVATREHRDACAASRRALEHGVSQAPARVTRNDDVRWGDLDSVRAA